MRGRGRRLLAGFVPKGIQDRLRALRPRVNQVLGDVNAVFNLGDGSFFVDGWLACRGGKVESIEILEPTGSREFTSTGPVAFDLYPFKRKDVQDSVTPNLPADHACFGYRLVVRGVERVGPAHRLRFRLEQSATIDLALDRRFLTGLTREQMEGRLREALPSYGLAKPLEEDADYTRVILHRALAEMRSRQKYPGFVTGWLRRPGNWFVILGWIDDAGEIAGDVRVVEAAGARLVGRGRLVRFARPRLDKGAALGMVLVLEDCHPKPALPIHLELRTPEGKECGLMLEGVEKEPREVVEEAVIAFNSAFHGAGRNRGGKLAALSGVIAEIARHSAAEIAVARELRWGGPSHQASVSLVIPVHKNYALTRQQLTELATDAFVRMQEMVLVLDAPEDAEWFRRLLDGLYEVVRLPLRLLVPSAKGGFATACNIGARASRTPFLLFLNSDIFPAAPGWLESMLSRFDEHPSAGIVGARLLHPDGSIQHAGMSWERRSSLGLLFANAHPFKGLSPSLVPLEGLQETPAVTGACMLLRAEDFEAAGGFDAGYLEGGYEDSDLCLRVRRLGKRVYCDHRSVLFHIEGGSFSADRRSRVLAVNAFAHHAKWERTISALSTGDSV